MPPRETPIHEEYRLAVGVTMSAEATHRARVPPTMTYTASRGAGKSCTAAPRRNHAASSSLTASAASAPEQYLSRRSVRAESAVWRMAAARWRCARMTGIAVWSTSTRTDRAANGCGASLELDGPAPSACIRLVSNTTGGRTTPREPARTRRRRAGPAGGAMANLTTRSPLAHKPFGGEPRSGMPRPGTIAAPTPELPKGKARR
eukprot:scaffold297485_cov27-Tisochrysis_lutea.AAC.3